METGTWQTPWVCHCIITIWMESLAVPTFVSLQHAEPDACQPLQAEGWPPAFACLLGGQGETGRCTGCSAVQSSQPGMGTENADGEESALKN